jgi:NAD(P)H-dependent FMN reductase
MQILAFAGSLRRDSSDKKLAREAVPLGAAFRDQRGIHRSQGLSDASL